MNQFNCTKCKELKNSIEFYKDKVKKTGLHSQCKKCMSEREKGKYSLNKEKYRLAAQEWRKNNPEQSAYINAKCNYGITREQFHSLNKECKICHSKQNLVIDHSHQTGRVRGRLCALCNRGLGQFKDNPIILERAADYIMGRIK